MDIRLKMHSNKKKRLLVFILALMLFSVIASTIASADVFDSVGDYANRFFSAYKVVEVGGKRELSSANTMERKVVDFALFFILFLSLTLLGLRKWFGKEAAPGPIKGIAISLAALLSLAIVSFTNVTLGLLYPFAKNILFLLMFMIIYSIVANKKVAGESKFWAFILALAITFAAFNIEGFMEDTFAGKTYSPLDTTKKALIPDMGKAVSPPSKSQVEGEGPPCEIVYNKAQKMWIKDKEICIVKLCRCNKECGDYWCARKCWEKTMGPEKENKVNGYYVADPTKVNAYIVGLIGEEKECVELKEEEAKEVTEEVEEVKEKECASEKKKVMATIEDVDVDEVCECTEACKTFEDCAKACGYPTGTWIKRSEKPISIFRKKPISTQPKEETKVEGKTQITELQNLLKQIDKFKNIRNDGVLDKATKNAIKKALEGYTTYEPVAKSIIDGGMKESDIIKNIVKVKKMVSQYVEEENI